MTSTRTVIEEIRDIDSGQLLGYYCKGHITPKTFAATVWFDYRASMVLGKVRHRYARIVGDWSEGYRQSALKFYDRSSRGSFPVTVWEK